MVEFRDQADHTRRCIKIPLKMVILVLWKTIEQ